MPVKFSKLTSAIRTKVSIFEPNEAGETEEIIISPKHRRITPDVAEELDRIEDEINRENKKRAEEQEKDSLPGLSKRKNVLAAQLSFLVLETDIEDEDRKLLPPTVETFRPLSVNFLSTLRMELLSTVMPKKKNSSTSDDGTRPAAESENDPVG